MILSRRVSRVSLSLIIAASIWPIAGRPAHADPGCDATCNAIKQGITKRLEDIGVAKVTECQSRIEASYAFHKAKDESCNCYPSPAALAEALQNLQRIRTRELGRCRVAGVDAQLAAVAEQRAARAAKLRSLFDRFQEQNREIGQWGKESERGLNDTIAKISEVTLTSILSGLLDKMVTTRNAKVDDMIKHAERTKNPRLVRASDLKEWLAALSADVKDKPTAQAKAIILQSLRADRLVLQQLTALVGQIGADEFKTRIAEAVARVEGGPREPASTREVQLGQYYMALGTAFERLQVEGLRSAAAVARTAAVLRLAPDIVDSVELFGRIYAIGQNLDGLDSLRKAAEMDRAIATTETRLLIQQRGVLETERKKVLAEVGP